MLIYFDWNRADRDETGANGYVEPMWRPLERHSYRTHVPAALPRARPV
jgi:hypothetical protein